MKKNNMLKQEVENKSYISFGIVLVLWELLPTFMIVWFFRVRRPQTGAMVSNIVETRLVTRLSLRSMFLQFRIYPCQRKDRQSEAREIVAYSGVSNG